MVGWRWGGFRIITLDKDSYLFLLRFPFPPHSITEQLTRPFLPIFSPTHPLRRTPLSLEYYISLAVYVDVRGRTILRWVSESVRVVLTSTLYVTWQSLGKLKRRRWWNGVRNGREIWKRSGTTVTKINCFLFQFVIQAQVVFLLVVGFVYPSGFLSLYIEVLRPIETCRRNGTHRRCRVQFR